MASSCNINLTFATGISVIGTFTRKNESFGMYKEEDKLVFDGTINTTDGYSVYLTNQVSSYLDTYKSFELRSNGDIFYTNSIYGFSIDKPIYVCIYYENIKQVYFELPVLYITPTITSPEITNVTKNTATASFHIFGTGGGILTSCIGIRKKGEDQDSIIWKPDNWYDNIGTDGTSYTFENLEPGTTYEVIGWVRNTEGTGTSYEDNSTDWGEFTTLSETLIDDFIHISLSGGTFVTVPAYISVKGSEFMKINKNAFKVIN